MATSHIKFLPVNGSCLVYNDNFSNVVKDYYNYICMLLYRVLEKSPQLNVIVVFENLQLRAIASDRRKMIYMYLNIEHTLVRPGGRSAENAPIGATPCEYTGGLTAPTTSRENYLVRIDKLPVMRQKHIIAEYSNPNIINVRESGLFGDIAQKMVYISPLLYEPVFYGSTPRDIDCLTTFICTKQPRRKALLEKAGSLIRNINNCFKREELQRLYFRTKVMINIHQTDHHHTFEELRVLPALCCGVVVVCERSPLWESVPYHKFVIWADYDEIVQKAREVLNNYEECYNFIFGGGGGAELRAILAKMEEDNYNNLKQKIEEVSRF